MDAVPDTPACPFFVNVSIGIQVGNYPAYCSLSGTDSRGKFFGSDARLFGYGLSTRACLVRNVHSGIGQYSFQDFLQNL